MFDYVFFDLDGTLTRSGDGIKKSAAHAIAQLGYPPLTDAQLDSFVGPPLLEMFEALLRHGRTNRARGRAPLPRAL